MLSARVRYNDCEAWGANYNSLVPYLISSSGHMIHLIRILLWGGHCYFDTGTMGHTLPDMGIEYVWGMVPLLQRSSEIFPHAVGFPTRWELAPTRLDIFGLGLSRAWWGVSVELGILAGPLENGD